MVNKFFVRFLLLIGLISVSFVSRVSAQQYGVVEEHKSALIERLQKERVLLGNNVGSSGEANKPGVPLKTGRKVTARGYRVQIYSGSSRTDAYSAQAKFKQTYKDLNTYVSYEQPNYRVKVGDFTSRNEAQALMNQLKRDYGAVFIFTETITIEY